MIPHIRHHVLPALMAALLVLSPLPLSAQQNNGNKVSMDFVNVDIAVVVKYISELTGRNFIIDEKVSGKVTIISPKMVTKDEAYKVFESILETYGFTAIETGDVTKIVPINEARQMASDVSIGTRPSRDLRDKMITQLIPLKHISAQNLINVIRPLVPATSYVAAYEPTNTMILVDLESNRTRIMRIIRQLDVEGFESSIIVEKLKYASARNLAEKVEQIMGEDKNQKQPGATLTKVIADERINALVIVGNDLYVKKVRDLIKQLDVESPPGRQELNVVYLKNADAEELSKVLNQIAENVAKINAAKGSPGGRPTPNGPNSDKIVVTADKSTNSLVITASPEDFETMRKVIQKLDIRRRQVFVEALIFEIRTDQTSKFGVEWRTTTQFSETAPVGFGGTNFGSINQAAANPFSTGQGLVLGVVDGTINFGGQTFLNLGTLVTALRQEQGVNILSTPNLLTTDNVEAEIFVGENVPIIKSTAQTTGATPIQNIERKDVGILLRVKPQINEDEYVKLEITQEISSIQEQQLDKASDIITFKRSATTSVTVKSDQNIILGGLIRDDSTETESKVPLLGDIPILGWLFKSKETQKIKNNLLIFLTPHIINTDEDMRAITRMKENSMRELQGQEPLEEIKPEQKSGTPHRLDMPTGNLPDKTEQEQPAPKAEPEKKPQRSYITPGKKKNLPGPSGIYQPEKPATPEPASPEEDNPFEKNSTVEDKQPATRPAPQQEQIPQERKPLPGPTDGGDNPQSTTAPVNNQVVVFGSGGETAENAPTANPDDTAGGAPQKPREINELAAPWDARWEGRSK